MATGALGTFVVIGSALTAASIFAKQAGKSAPQLAAQ
jgi:hypothetical protein